MPFIDINSKTFAMKKFVALAAVMMLSIISSGSFAAEPGDCKNKKDGSQTSKAASLIGGLVEGVATFGLNKIGIKPDASYRNTLRSFLTDGIACQLTDNEQQQAEAASKTALDKGVGASTKWRSKDRDGVSGETSVTDETKTASGELCRTARSVINVDGEETLSQKTLCLRNGSWVAKV